jgi:hypothetical protein
MSMLAQLIDHPAIPLAFGLSLALFALGAIAVPFAIARLPADYFVRRSRPASGHPGARTVLRVIKNVAGVLLVVAGVAMLVLPGQGLLSILVGLSLIDFPGKRGFERRLVRLPGVLQVVTAIRRRAGQPPFQLDAVPDSGA